MTAVNIFVERDHARIYTDGGIYDKTGMIEGFMPKVIPMPHLNCVVICAGQPATGWLAIGLVADIGGSFDEVVDKLQDATRSVRSHFDKSAIWLVGYSQRDGRMRAFMWSHEPVNGLPSFTRIRVEEIVMPQPCDASLSDGADPVALMNSQRQNLNASKGIQGSVVGGFIQETIVAEEGSKTRIIHRWPDVMGEKIHPIAA
ncbi:hypothetical protein JZX86_18050 [Agrobacterium rosae]|uniref:hypothetical protein n=1 Tax=Agrobacterium rosae TaxID=1972867 RepID=UPI0019D34E06|nr:hypothetical protein [Agrobacterium rosae]MBN7807259.1 hypothetical protein [Agrobacterium rosae]